MEDKRRRVLLTYEVPVLVTVDLDSETVEQVQIAKENSTLDASKGVVTADDALAEVPATEAKQAVEIADEAAWPTGMYV